MAHCQTTKSIKMCDHTADSSEASLKISVIQTKTPPTEFLGSSLVSLNKVAHLA